MVTTFRAYQEGERDGVPEGPSDPESDTGEVARLANDHLSQLVEFRTEVARVRHLPRF
jgi:hypothetical protein